MRVKGNTSDGYLLCFLINLVFNFWWGLLALALWVLHMWLKIPLIWSLVGLFVWLVIAFVGTLLVMVIWAAGSSADPAPPRKNLNPYSAKNSDFFEKHNIPSASPAQQEDESSVSESSAEPDSAN